MCGAPCRKAPQISKTPLLAFVKEKNPTNAWFPIRSMSGLFKYLHLGRKKRCFYVGRVTVRPMDPMALKESYMNTTRWAPTSSKSEL